MSGATSADRADGTSIRERPLRGCVEIVFAAPRGADLPRSFGGAPGAIMRLQERAVALHFAPSRWLLPDAESALLAEAAAADALSIDVEGKWRCFEIRGPQAAAVLSAGVNLPAVLEQRDCAAVPLFDCPTIIVRGVGDAVFDVFVHASYALSLRAALLDALARLGARR